MPRADCAALLKNTLLSKYSPDLTWRQEFHHKPFAFLFGLSLPAPCSLKLSYRGYSKFSAEDSCFSELHFYISCSSHLELHRLLPYLCSKACVPWRFPSHLDSADLIFPGPPSSKKLAHIGCPVAILSWTISSLRVETKLYLLVCIHLAGALNKFLHPKGVQ